MIDQRISKVQSRLMDLEAIKDLNSAKSAILSIMQLLVPEISTDSNESFRVYNDKDGKLKANSGWFQSDEVIADRLAVYSLDVPPESNLDVKVFAVNKSSKGTIAWAVGLTPNYEDEPFNGRYNVGIDFVIPSSKDRVIIALSKNYVIRTLELKGKLTATFLEILSSWTNISDTSRKAEFHSLLWNSLDLAPINKRFYEGISQRFLHLRQFLEESKILDSNHAAQFANRLIGRILFSWFLAKKNFLNVDQNYFESAHFQDDTHYYKEKLESLFFDVLNVPVAERTADDTKTPYLNGGLFEAKPGDLYKENTLVFPKNYFADLYSFLKSYNFTTDESTSEFQQVAIDPEMLGRIFENLLAEISDDTGEQARKAKGAFYTPRQIVDYMCRETLKDYLRSKFIDEPNFEDRIYQLVEATEREFQDQDHNWRRDLKPFKEKLIDALNQLRVIDPACGSGAFPIGMMQLLLKVYGRLETRFDAHKTKLSIIERNIFGVDIEPMAVEISRLRAWLALIVDDSETVNSVKPLPNLDFKFVCANSLVDLASDNQPSLFEDLELDTKLQNLRDEYFSTGSSKVKQKLKSKYSKLVDEEVTLFGESERTRQLKSFRPFETDAVSEFFNSLHMFGFSDFDIVIGNPPYVSHESISVEKKKLSRFEVFEPFADLHCYFFEAAYKLVMNRGKILSFITSNSYIKAEYGRPLRKFISETNGLQRIINIEESQLFEAATVNTAILIMGPIPNENVEVVNSVYSHAHLTFEKFVSESVFEIQSSKFTEKPWILVAGENAEVLDLINKAGKSLESRGAFIRLGLATGSNHAFIIDEKTKNGLVESDPKSLEIIKPVIGGEDISQYFYKSKKYLILSKNGVDVPNSYPAIFEHFDSFGQKFKLRGAQGRHWTNLRACSFIEEFKKEKIVWIELATKGRFAYSNEEIYLLNSAIFMVPPSDYSAKALTGLLNSSLINFYMGHISQTSGMGTNRWIKATVETFPIPAVSSENQNQWQALERIVEGILTSGPGVPVDLESTNKINVIACELYNIPLALAKSVGIITSD